MNLFSMSSLFQNDKTTPYSFFFFEESPGGCQIKKRVKVQLNTRMVVHNSHALDSTVADGCCHFPGF